MEKMDTEFSDIEMLIENNNNFLDMSSDKKRKLYDEEEIVEFYISEYLDKRKNPKLIKELLLQFDTLMENDYLKHVIDEYTQYKNEQWYDPDIIANKRIKNKSSMLVDNTKIINNVFFKYGGFYNTHNIENDIIKETENLFIYHMIEEMKQNSVPVPRLKLDFSVPTSLKKFTVLAKKFRNSQARKWVYDKAENVELRTLNFTTFTELLCELFQNGGVTWERIMVLFFFSVDIFIRIIRNKLVKKFHCIFLWTMRFLRYTLSFFVQESGGWDNILVECRCSKIRIYGSCLGIVICCFLIGRRISKLL